MTERTTNPIQYVLVYATLLVLTLVTVIAASAPLGSWHTPVALSIAAGKAVLVILFFMHVLHSGKLTTLVLIGALSWLAILIGFIMSDYLTRSWLT